MNPFELNGPQFLLFFAVAGVVSLILVRLLRAPLVALLADEEASSWAEGELHPYEVAYLRDGAMGATSALTVAMLHSGLVTGESLSKLEMVGEVPADAHPLEQAFHRSVGGVRTLPSLLRALRRPLLDVRRALVRRGLWLDPGRLLALRAVLALLPGAVLWIGIVRLMRGHAAGRPIGFLVVLSILMAIVALMVLVTLRARTRKGDEELARLGRTHAALRTAAQDPSDSLTGQELALAMGVFGTTALATGGMAPTFFGGGAHAGHAATSSSCGGSSCGGGGCGGGCGGCGG